jgi:hypothetical protein
LPQEQHRQEAKQDEHIAEEQCETGTSLLDQHGGTRRYQNHRDRRGQDRETGAHCGVTKHVLQELLPDEHRAHQ